MATRKRKTRASEPKIVQNFTRKLRQVEGSLAFHLDLFGDVLASREGYMKHHGLDALHYYLVQKHHWLPSQARSLNWVDLQFLFAEEMSGWIVPPAFRL